MELDQLLIDGNFGILSESQKIISLKDIVHNHTVQELYEELSYANDFNFVYQERDLKLGLNEIREANGQFAQIELKMIPTMFSATCHLLQYKNFQGKGVIICK